MKDAAVLPVEVVDALYGRGVLEERGAVGFELEERALDCEGFGISGCQMRRSRRAHFARFCYGRSDGGRFDIFLDVIELG